MPLYEFSCPTHERFEVLLPIRDSEITHRVCPECGAASERVVSLTTMKPDSLWAGHMTKHGYVTSQAHLDRIRLEKGVLTLDNQNDVDAMRKTAREARESQDKKLDQEGQAVFEKAISGTGLVNSFGELRPEATDTWRNNRIHRDNAPL